MIKRIEFTLNLNDPREAKIYHALKPSLRYRHGGAIIRQALGRFLVVEPKKSDVGNNFDLQEKTQHE